MPAAGARLEELAGTRAAAAADGAAQLVLGVSVVTLAGAMVLPTIVNYLFPLAALLVGLRLLDQGRRTTLWEFTAWLYLLTPFFRRFVDWRSGFHENSPILLAAPLVALLGLLALRRAARVRPAVAASFIAALLALAYATASGLLLRSPVPVVVAVLQWVSPLALGLLVLLSPDQADDMRAALLRITHSGLLVLGAYGIVQFFLLPPWDQQWMLDVRTVLDSIGAPEAGKLRVFSTLNAPGPCGGVLGILLVLGIGTRRSRRDALGLVLGGVALALTEVRAAWIVLAVALFMLFCSRRVAVGRVLAASVLLVLLLATLGGPIADAVGARISSTNSAGSRDISLQARLSFQANVLPGLLADPLGDGLGSTGTAVRRDTSTGTGIADPDSGYVESLKVLGAPLGFALLLALAIAALGCWPRALRSPRHTQRFEVALAASLVTLPVNLFFGNPLIAAGGIFVWTTLALTATARGGNRLTKERITV